jgi:phosphatidylglycerol:prolipoprotein diacylglycerol transferase
MQQVLFYIPILKDSFPPNGIPIHGFGVMLFITFVLGVWYLGWQATRTGSNLPRERVQDLVIVLFISGLLGARLTYMIQYGIPLTLSNFVKIWEGGIVLYGGIIAGILAFILFYYIVLKRFQVKFWRLADAIAPALALGIALGRVGCFLNGCCFGHVAEEGCPAVAFPILTAPSKEIVVNEKGYQTTVGFTTTRRPDGLSVIDRVEPLSEAAKVGLKPGDAIVGVNGQPNFISTLVVFGPADGMKTVAEIARGENAKLEEPTPEDLINPLRIHPADGDSSRSIRQKILAIPSSQLRTIDTDYFHDYITKIPRGQQTISLTIDRNGETIETGSFTPRTLGLHPTQLYETTSMILLMLFLTAYYPFRRHDGQVFVLFLICYAMHRFTNEILRNDTPIEGFRMTLSQNISMWMVVAGIGMEIFLRWTQPNLRVLRKNQPVAA